MMFIVYSWPRTPQKTKVSKMAAPVLSLRTSVPDGLGTVVLGTAGENEARTCTAYSRAWPSSRVTCGAETGGASVGLGPRALAGGGLLRRVKRRMA